MFYYSDRFERLLGRLQRPRSFLVIAAAALGLVLPSLGNRLVLDDNVLALLLRDDPGIEGLRSRQRGTPALPPGPLNLFTFTTGDPETNRALRDEGALLPWWVDEHHLNAFLRPLSSLTHWLDFRLWPGSPWLMHLHSVLWYGALLLAVALVYRRLATGPPALTALAFLLFALDDAHGQTVSWISNRNALVAITLALPALIAHHRFRSEGWLPGVWLGPLFLAAGLLAGESALTICGYLLAYALFLERGAPARRLLGLSGYGAVLALWLLAFRWLNLGSYGSAAYSDPIHEPLGFVKALSFNLPVLLSAQLGLPVANLAFWADPALGPALLLLSLLTLAAVLWLLVPLLKRDPGCRFWATGTLLAALPLAASLPGERLLLGVGVGASPLVAGLLLTAFDRSRREGERRAGWLRKVLLIFLFVTHLFLAPLLLPFWARSMEVVGAAVERAEGSIPASADIRDKTVIIVNAPFDIMASFIQVMRECRHVNRPRHLYWLAVASSPLEVSRSGERTLRIRPRAGFLYTPPERHYRADSSTLGRGALVRLPELTVTVTRVTGDGRPQEADFEFREGLDSRRYFFLVHENGKYRRFKLPAAGETVELPAQDFFRTMVSELLGLKPKVPR